MPLNVVKDGGEEHPFLWSHSMVGDRSSWKAPG